MSLSEDASKTIESITKVDFDKTNTFFLTYYLDESDSIGYRTRHVLRPSSSTYEEVTDVSKFRVITTGPAVYSFAHAMTIEEILLQCSVRGINVDFIDMMKTVKDGKGFYDSKEVCVRNIDCHKKNMLKMVDEACSPQFYLVCDKRSNMRFIVIDRLKQSAEVRYLAGKYDKKAVIARFSIQDDAIEYCKKKNGII